MVKFSIESCNANGRKRFLALRVICMGEFSSVGKSFAL